MNRILVGVDGSAEAATALAWAAQLAGRSGAEVVVAHAFWLTESELHRDRYDQWEAAARRDLEGEWSEAARDAGVAYRTLFLEGDVGTLLEAADAEDADLLVVGTRGRGGFSGLHMGSVAHHLAHHTARPMAIVPSGATQRPIERALIGVDGSDVAADAVRWCARTLPPFKPAVIAVHVTSTPEWGDDPRRRLGYEAHEVREWANPIIEAGLDVTPVVVRDAHPVAALALTARESDADIVVVGTRGLGGFFGLRLGRVPLQLLEHITVPLVMVPPSQPFEPGGDR